MTRELTIIQPDDWHLHVRDLHLMTTVVPLTAARFKRAVIMPNLVPPIADVPAALAYRERILSAAGAYDFDPLMTLYLTPATTIQSIRDASEHAKVVGVKWYPAGATTHSQSGVQDIANSMPILREMSDLGLPLLIHGEVTDPDVDVFDREARFIHTILKPLLKRLPMLQVVLEHITTADGIDFVQSHGANVAGTLTPQHLLLNRNAMFQGGLRPHHYCLPVLKRDYHRKRLVKAATSGDTSFFLGTDSAPHTKEAKESACGCAGVFSAHAGIELYAEAFARADALDKLEAFASLNGPAFYGLPPNTGTITLIQKSWQVPLSIKSHEDTLIPFRAGESMPWSIKTNE